MSKMCVCGHNKWDHSIGLDGKIGGCNKEISKDWEWCECKKFVEQEDSNIDKNKGENVDE